MVKPGNYNTLEVAKEVDFGLYLDGKEFGEILLPQKWVPEGISPGDILTVFIYFDSQGRPIATTMKPKAVAGEFALLEVTDVTKVGAFLDWGLEKDLLLPFREQIDPANKGDQCLVYILVDPKSKRLIASAHLERFLDLEPADYETGQQVDIIVWQVGDIGYKAIINQKHQGLLYSNEVFRAISPGQSMKAYVSQIRPDGKIDLLLDKPGHEKIDGLSQKVLDVLDDNQGYLPFHDKSPAEEIYRVFHMSKKNFKKALGTLYKQKQIVLEDNGFRKSNF